MLARCYAALSRLALFSCGSTYHRVNGLEGGRFNEAFSTGVNTPVCEWNHLWKCFVARCHLQKQTLTCTHGLAIICLSDHPSFFFFLPSSFFSLRSLVFICHSSKSLLSIYDSLLVYLTSAWCSLLTSDLQMNYMLRSWSIRPSARSWTMPSMTWPLCSDRLPLSIALYIPSSHSSSLSIPALSPSGFGFQLWSWNPESFYVFYFLSPNWIYVTFSAKKKLLKNSFPFHLSCLWAYAAAAFIIMHWMSLCL